MVSDNITKYSIWLFNRYEQPEQHLPEIFDLVKNKNPIATEDMSFSDLSALFTQWKTQKHYRPPDAELRVNQHEKAALSEVAGPDDTVVKVVRIGNVQTVGSPEVGGSAKARLTKRDEDSERFGDTQYFRSRNDESAGASNGQAMDHVFEQNANMLNQIMGMQQGLGGGVGVVGHSEVCEYNVVKELLLSNLVESVQEQIAKGWQPIGGATKITGTGANSYVQTMVRYVGWEERVAESDEDEEKD